MQVSTWLSKSLFICYQFGCKVVWANFVCNWFRITAEIIFKLLRAAIWRTLSRHPFLRQVIDLDLLLYTGLDWEHCRFVLMQRFKYTNKLLLNEGKLKSFQVQGRAWIIFCTVTLPVPPSVCKCVDLPSFTVTVRQDRRCGHDSGGYHEIQGSRKGDLGVSEQPDAIEYLSFHCDMQQLALVQALKQRRFLCADFYKVPNQPGISCGNIGFLTL